jgi:hypothetical protein
MHFYSGGSMYFLSGVDTSDASDYMAGQTILLDGGPGLEQADGPTEVHLRVRRLIRE